MRNLYRSILLDIILLIAVITVLALLFSDTSGPLAGIRKNKLGIEAVASERFSMGEKFFLEALSLEPESIAPRNNLGLTYEMMERPERAYNEYSALLRSESLPEAMQLLGHFNAGNASAQMEKVETALEHYQTALNVSPGNEDVRTNIELLFQGAQGKGKGKGSGQNKDKNEEENDGEGEEPKDNQPPSQGGNEKEQDKKPKEFDSKELSKEDVRKILEEIKAQEQKVRALDYSGKKGKEQPMGKDW